MKYCTLSLVFLFSFTLFSCSDDETAVFNKAELLENVTDNLILPTFESFKQESRLLDQAATAFQTDPTVTTLTAVQDAWKTTTIQWKKSEIYMLGEVDAFEAQIYFYPARSNLMDNVLADQAIIDADYMLLVGAAAKGLPALELLLFENGKTTEEVLEKFTSAPQAARRRDYVAGIAGHINRQAVNLQEAWEAYAPTFKASVSGTMEGTSVLANQLLLMIENLTNTRLGEPLSKDRGGDVLPEKVEAYHSQFSNELMIANLRSISALYTGSTGIGFDDYLNFVQGNTTLSTTISEQFGTLNLALEQFDQPLQELVVSSQSSVEKAYEEGKALTVLIKADMFSMLSITVAFNDNDGD